MKLQTPKVVGLTGGLGSGKSTARGVWESLGVPCADADTVAREIHQDSNHPAMAELALAFPFAITPDGRLSRGTLRTLFATDPAANTMLKSILTPHVLAHLQRWTAQQDAPYVVWESALLIEEKITVDRMVVVDASAAQQRARVQARNPDWTLAHIDGVLSMQLSREARLGYADDTIHNEGDLAALRAQVLALHQAYLARWKLRDQL
jgi:dephospho-CoA kinase